MQQAARVSQFTAFMYLGELIEFGPTTQMFTSPERSDAHRTTSPAASAEPAIVCVSGTRAALKQES